MGKSVITLHSGEILVGEILEDSDPAIKELKQQQTIFKMIKSENSIWIKREKHITFLDKSEIKSTRPANIFDKEL